MIFSSKINKKQGAKFGTMRLLTLKLDSKANTPSKALDMDIRHELPGFSKLDQYNFSQNGLGGVAI